MAKQRNKKVVRYRRPLNINVGMIIFALIFIYISFYVYTYLKRDKIEFYEVVEGGIVNDKRYTGIIFREEVTKYTEHAGNINYYLREGKKAAVGTRIYSIDETGALSKLLAERAEDDTSLSKENLSSLKKQLSVFSQGFTNERFKEVYGIKYTLDSAVLEYVNIDALRNLDSVINEMGINFEQARSDASGIVSYTIDEMETLLPSQVTEEMFNKTNYVKKVAAKSGSRVEIGAPAYKLITSGDWSIVFPLTEEDAALYNGNTALTVKFSSHSLQTDVAYSTLTGADGKLYGRLDFSKYLVDQFVSDRYVDFEIVTEAVRGLKIPRSSVATKDFFLVPKGFVVKSENDAIVGFYKEVYGEDGKASITLVNPDIYYTDEEYYYVNAGEGSELKAGDYIIKNDSQDRFQIGITSPLQGVYNINRGYTAFRRIEVLTSNDEYYTIKKGTSYGLSVYDHIVLDAAAVEHENYLIYQ